MEIERYEVRIAGIVQGVGFRPFIFNIANSLALTGWVNNSGSDVIIDVEGRKELLKELINKINSEAPPLSHISKIDIQIRPFYGFKDFTIRESTVNNDKTVYISPDVSICKDCERELFEHINRRYLYPFINCTNCGPRFTIIKGVPYDRVNTTMNKFRMCSDCASEYNDPSNRRYHAQPISCFNCGPKLEFLDMNGKKVDTQNPIKLAIEKLAEGSILAVKGLGGYHLAVDARNKEAVIQLRQRKIRDDKPFALMVRDYETALKYCYINESEKKLLESYKKPIVLLKRKENSGLPNEISPTNPYLGIMLPYTPVHMLLFSDAISVQGAIAHLLAVPPPNKDTPPERGAGVGTLLEALVMTSGNRSSEPIYFKDNEAVENLSDIADYYLCNDRDIHIRTDDSVTRVFREKEYILRRSRGYVPFPLNFQVAKDAPQILACGGELKSTFCLNKGEEFYMSHHIGDLENIETLSSFEDGIEHFKRLLDINPRIVAYDLHPEYMSTKYAVSLDLKNKIAVQHHHAHIASCMAENDLNEEVIGVAFDGTGYGEDGNLWGGEFFTGKYDGFKRYGQFEYVKMPGGEAAIKEPWRMAVSYLCKIGKVLEVSRFLNQMHVNKVDAIIQMMDKNVNCPLTSSVGRLFDAVSALIGIRREINYEGQAAIELEYVSCMDYKGEYQFAISDSKEVFEVSVDDIFKGIVSDILKKVSINTISAKFHETMSNIVLKGCNKICDVTGLKKVALSGGVFQNMILLEKSVSKLESDGFKVYVHSKVPANDGGIALGQAVIAARRSV